MNILYCGDKNIADGLTLSVLSLIGHTREPLNILILTADLAAGNRRCVALPEDFAEFLDMRLKVFDPRHSVRLFNVTPLFGAEPPTANLGTRFTPCCMLRLYADLVPDVPDRVLYLDNDVVCRGDFSELYYTDLGGAELAGVPDYYGRWFFRRRVIVHDYLNSGVLLLDMKKIRADGLFRRCRRMCAAKRMFMPDQSALNKLAKSKKIMPRRYNEQRRQQNNTVFRHFTMTFRLFPTFHTVSVKPWQEDKMHEVLKIYEYDALIAESGRLMADYRAFRDRSGGISS